MTQKSLFDYFKLCVTTKYCSFSGRARRAEFWSFVLFKAIGSALVGLLSSMLLGSYSVVDYSQGDLQAHLSNLQARQSLRLVYSLVMLLPTLGVSVRRLHDTGRTGWWVTLPFVFTIVFFSTMITAMFGALVEIFVISGIVLLLSSIVLLVCFCLDSQPGQNQYGPNPKDEDLMPYDHNSSMDYIKQSDNTY